LVLVDHAVEVDTGGTSLDAAGQSWDFIVVTVDAPSVIGYFFSTGRSLGHEMKTLVAVKSHAWRGEGAEYVHELTVIDLFEETIGTSTVRARRFWRLSVLVFGAFFAGVTLEFCFVFLFEVWSVAIFVHDSSTTSAGEFLEVVGAKAVVVADLTRWRKWGFRFALGNLLDLFFLFFLLSSHLIIADISNLIHLSALIHISHFIYHSNTI
jgi:hypothetical protein